MLKAGVQVEFNPKTDDMLEMRVVDVSVDSEQSLEDHLDYVQEILWERNTLFLL